MQHFRYENRHIDFERVHIKDEGAGIIDKDGVIFFTANNDTTKRKEERNIKNMSTRRVRIVDYLHILPTY